jgi:hypothetical protein
MNERPELRRRGAPWWGWLLALLLLPLAAPLTAAAAPVAPAVATPVHAGSPPAPTALILFGALRQILGDQTTMIQVAAVIGAIGIFWLTRTIGKG